MSELILSSIRVRSLARSVERKSRGGHVGDQRKGGKKKKELTVSDSRPPFNRNASRLGHYVIEDKLIRGKESEDYVPLFPIEPFIPRHAYSLPFESCLSFLFFFFPPLLLLIGKQTKFVG